MCAPAVHLVLLCSCDKMITDSTKTSATTVCTACVCHTRYELPVFVWRPIFSWVWEHTEEKSTTDCSHTKQTLEKTWKLSCLLLLYIKNLYRRIHETLSAVLLQADTTAPTAAAFTAQLGCCCPLLLLLLSLRIQLLIVGACVPPFEKNRVRPT